MTSLSSTELVHPVLPVYPVLPVHFIYRELTFAGFGAPSGPLSQSCALEMFGMPHW